MFQPKVSVIIPAYNVENYFEKCLLSMLNQTLKEIEIVIVVDGATDGTLAIANKYKEIDYRIKVYNTENNGTAIARNIGLNNSKGKYVVFIDADDWILKESLFELYECAEINDADIVCFGYRRIYIDGSSNDETKYKNCSIKKFKVGQNKSEDILGCFLSVYGQGVSNKFIKKDILVDNNLHFETDRQVQAEDLYVSYQLLFTNPNVLILNKPFYNYMQHDSSSLHSTPTKIGERYLQLFERIYERIPCNEKKDENEKVLSWLSFYMTSFIYTNWKNNKYEWFNSEMEDYKDNATYSKLMIKCMEIPRINNEKINVYILRKFYCFLFIHKLFYMGNLLMFLRLSFLPKVKQKLKN